MKIFSLVNEKGGVGKTTTAVNLAYNLIKKGYKVLLIDFDPQANASTHLGVTPQNKEYTIYDTISTEYQNGIPMSEAVVKVHGIHLIPSSKKLAGLEGQCVNMPGKEFVLRDQLSYLPSNNLDYVLIDCPGKPGFLTNNAICASTDIITTVQAEYLSLDSLKEIMSTMRVIRERLNVSPDLFGVVVTMFDKRRLLNKEVFEKVKAKLPNKILMPPIRDNIALAESPSHGLPISVYSPNCAGAKDYDELVESFIGKIKEGEK